MGVDLLAYACKLEFKVEHINLVGVEKLPRERIIVTAYIGVNGGVSAKLTVTLLTRLSCPYTAEVHHYLNTILTPMSVLCSQLSRVLTSGACIHETRLHVLHNAH